MKAHLGTYQTFNVMSWMIEGTLGTRLRPGMPRSPAAQTGLTLEDDIPVSDVEAHAVKGFVGPDSGSETGGIDVTTEGLPMMLPEIPMVVPAAPLQVDASVHQQLQSPPKVGLGSAQHEAAGQSVEMADVESAVPVTPEEPGDEPAAKRAKLSVSRVSGEDMVHVDETSLFEQSLLNFDAYDDFDFHTITDGYFDDGQNHFLRMKLSRWGHESSC